MNKKCIYLALLALVITGCKSSEKPSSSIHASKLTKYDGREVYVDDGHRYVKPQMIGGQQSLNRHLKYPEIARLNYITGKVIVKFIVSKKGYAKKINVVRSLGYGCDQAAVKALKKVRFKPALKDGKPVNFGYTWPVRFQLN